MKSVGRGVWYVVLLAACGRSDSRGSSTPPSVRYPNHVAAGGSQPPSGDITTPLKNDSTDATDGSKIFSQMNCDGCHGGGALGWVGPSLVDGRWRYGGTDGALFQSMFYGRPRGMPAYGGIMSPGAIWKVIAYLRAQPIPAAVPTERWAGEQKP